MEKIRDLQTATGKHVKTKVTDIQRLYSEWLWLVTAVYKPSFPDAKPLEHLSKDFLSGDFAGDFAEMVNGFTYIL